MTHAPSKIQVKFTKDSPFFWTLRIPYADV